MKRIKEDYTQKPAEYLDKLVALSGRLSLDISKLLSPNQINLQQLIKDLIAVHDLSLKTKAVFDGLYPDKAGTKMFEFVGGNHFRLATETQKNDPTTNLTDAERSRMTAAFKKVGLDGNGRFTKKEHGLAAVTKILDALGFNLDMVTADSIMGDKGSRSFIFRRKNDEGQDIFTEKPEIENSRIVFSWQRMDGPTHQYPQSPSKFEILVYAS